jgi:hypothetical protein
MKPTMIQSEQVERLGSELLTREPQLILARYGWQGNVGRFSVDERCSSEVQSQMLRRGRRIVIEAGRGIEAAESLGVVRGAVEGAGAAAGGVALRLMNPEDELLQGQLTQLGRVSQQRCAQWLETSGSTATLLHVEPLLNCKTLLFHFLHDVDQMVQQQVDQLIEMYEREVANDAFVQKVLKGCGPGCGTVSATGGGCKTTSACAGCKNACR